MKTGVELFADELQRKQVLQDKLERSVPITTVNEIVLAAQQRESKLREALERLASMEAFDVPRATANNVDDELLKRIAFAQQALAEVGSPEQCAWTLDSDTCSWDTACGEKWQFMNDGPAENKVRFCQGCGKPVAITPTLAEKEKQG